MIEQWIRRGFAASSVAWSIPSFAATPGPKLSITTSARRAEREEHLAIGVVAQVERRAPLAPQPHACAGELGERIARGRLDPGDAGAVIGEQHAGHRSGDAPRQVEHLDALEDPGAATALGCIAHAA